MKLARGGEVQACDNSLLRSRIVTAALLNCDVLDNVTLYWVTNTAISSARLYWDTAQIASGGFFDARGVKSPVAVSAFPDEIYAAPRSWAERAYPKLIHYNALDKGGALCRLGTARAVRLRAARRVQIASLDTRIRPPSAQAGWGCSIGPSCWHGLSSLRRGEGACRSIRECPPSPLPCRCR